jgi:hypothetical protein
VDDLPAQFKGVPGSFLCAEGFGISLNCNCFTVLSLLHEEDGTVGVSEGGWYATFVAATKKAPLWKLKNRKHTSSFLSNKNYFIWATMEK